MKERERERQRGNREIRYTQRQKYDTYGIEIEGGNEAWDTEKRKRQNDKEYIDWA